MSHDGYETNYCIRIYNERNFMYNQQNVNEFTNKPDKSVIEIRYDFNKLQPEEKQKVAEYIIDTFKIWGISVSIDAILKL